MIRGPWARVLVLAFAVGGCSESPVEPVGTRTEFDPPETWSLLWEDVEFCSGRTGSPAGIRWFLVQEFSSPGVLGQWRESREITLRIDVWNDHAVVKHEMLHDLLRGDPHHASPAWADCDLPVGTEG